MKNLVEGSVSLSSAILNSFAPCFLGFVQLQKMMKKSKILCELIEGNEGKKKNLFLRDETHKPDCSRRFVLHFACRQVRTQEFFTEKKRPRRDYSFTKSLPCKFLSLSLEFLPCNASDEEPNRTQFICWKFSRDSNHLISQT